jgi:O-antigen ligase
MDEFRAEPLHGGGAGSFEAEWLQSPSYAGFARDAHSLYAETLGELGIVGLCLLVATFVAAALTGLGRAVARVDAAPALLAAFLAYAVGAAVDWMWELTAVTLVAVVLLALMTGPATRPVRRYLRSDPPGRRVSLALGAAVVVLGLFAVGAAGLGLVSRLKIQDSQAAIARGDAVAALDDALAAHSIEPWAATPYVQAALVEEQAGQLEQARDSIGKAIDRDTDDWRLWLIQTRIETVLGDGAAAARSLERARQLNPNSALLAQGS